METVAPMCPNLIRVYVSPYYLDGSLVNLFQLPDNRRRSRAASCSEQDTKFFHPANLQEFATNNTWTIPGGNIILRRLEVHLLTARRWRAAYGLRAEESPLSKGKAAFGGPRGSAMEQKRHSRRLTG